jgi:hypothetical protein
VGEDYAGIGAAAWGAFLGIVPRNVLRCFAAWALALVCSMQGAEPKHQDGVMLQAAEYDWCHYDCFMFDRPTYFYCVKVADKVLVGSRKADWAWMYDTSQLMQFQGKTVALRNDKASIWIVRPDGKETHLAQDYSEDVFSNPACVSEVHRHWLRQLEHSKRPDGVPAAAVLVPKGSGKVFSTVGPHFWVTCNYDPDANFDRCTWWDQKGVQSPGYEFVDSSNHTPVAQADLVIDPLTTEVYYEIHLRNGVVLKDWAKSRINNQPSADSVRPTAKP